APCLGWRAGDAGHGNDPAGECASPAVRTQQFLEFDVPFHPGAAAKEKESALDALPQRSSLGRAAGPRPPGRWPDLGRLEAYRDCPTILARVQSLTARQDPHWPGIAPALGLRAGDKGLSLHRIPCAERKPEPCGPPRSEICSFNRQSGARVGLFTL